MKWLGKILHFSGRITDNEAKVWK